MNETLARMFGNLPVETAEESLEKAASVEIIHRLAQEQNVDLSGTDLGAMSVDELHAVINEAAGTAPAEDGMQEKLAEATLVGQAIAHSYVAELRNMDAGQVKQAQYAEQGASAFDTLAQIRAQEILASVQQEQQKTASFDDVLNQRAQEILYAAGYR